MLFGKKKEEVLTPPTDCVPVILSSICTGEKVIGFKNTNTGEMVQAVSMKSEKDAENFCRKYGVKREDIKVVY
jgi:hypothetical protein